MNTLVLAIALSVSVPAPDIVVVCPPEFEQALGPWLDYRRSQGHTITVVSSAGTSSEIRQRIRAQASGGGLKHVLLIGDAPAPSEARFRVPLPGTGQKVQPAALSASGAPLNDARLQIPVHYARAKITLRWGGEPLIATDNYYADLDDDLSPDLAIGRLTPNSPDALTAMIDKIIAYERNQDYGPWRTRISFVAGTGGFGSFTDKLIERVAGNLIRRHLPATYQSWITYAQPPGRPSADLESLQKQIIDRLNEGCAYWVYIGHGDEHSLVSAPNRLSNRWHTVFSARDARRIKPVGGPSIALFLACRTGAFDRRHDCLAEELLRAPAGPVAVIAGSRVTMPYAMAILGQGMMVEAFENRRPTIGEVFLHAKRRLLPPASDRRVGLATVVAVSRAFELIPADVFPISERMAVLRIVRFLGTLPSDLMQERAEHVALFNLLGDPLLRLRHPPPLLEAARPSRSH
jgi:hypothetical protein